MDSEQRAIRAKQLQEDPVFREVMDDLKASAVEAWTRTSFENNRQREFSWMLIKAIERIETGLQSIVDEQVITSAALVRAPQ